MKSRRSVDGGEGEPKDKKRTVAAHMGSATKTLAPSSCKCNSRRGRGGGGASSGLTTGSEGGTGDGGDGGECVVEGAGLG